MSFTIYNFLILYLIGNANITEYTYNGLHIGGWYGDYNSVMSGETYECSGVPGSTDC